VNQNFGIGTGFRVMNQTELTFCFFREKRSLKMDEDYSTKDVLTPETVYEPPIALPMFSNRPKYIPWGLLDFDHIPKSHLKTKTYYGRRRIINPWGFPEISPASIGSSPPKSHERSKRDVQEVDEPGWIELLTSPLQQR
jgi:hypothetical protein